MIICGYFLSICCIPILFYCVDDLFNNLHAFIGGYDFSACDFFNFDCRFSFSVL